MTQMKPPISILEKRCVRQLHRGCKSLWLATVIVLATLCGKSEGQQPNQPFALNTAGNSALHWPFANSIYASASTGTDGWVITQGAGAGGHLGGEYYADDWSRTGGALGAAFNSPLGGTVLFVGTGGEPTYGNQVVVRSSQDPNFAFRVAHLSLVSVTVGQTVSVGTKLGEVGSTGNSTGPHAHCVLYKSIDQTYLGGLTGVQRLQQGYGFGYSGSPNQFSAPYYFNAATSPATRTLTVASSNPNSGVTVGASPADKNGVSFGTTSLSLTYDQNTSVILATGATENGNAFQNWARSDGVNYPPGQTAVSLTVDNNYTMTAIYASPPSYTITASAGAGGSINPSGGITKSAGSSQMFTASPSANYVVNQWLVDGGAVQTGGTSFTLNNIQASRTVQVTFTFVPPIRTLTVASSNPNSGVTVAVSPADKNGVSSGTTSLSLTYDQNTTVILATGATENGNAFQNWARSDGVNYPPGQNTVSFTVDNTYTMTAIYAAPPSYTITATAGTGGGISPSGGITKNAGESQAFTASPSANYVVNQWLVDGGAVQTGGTSFTLNNIQASRTVQVTFTFVPATRTLTVASSNPNSGVTVAVSPADKNGVSSGITSLSLTYDQNTTVILATGATENGNAFQNWARSDGVNYPSGQNTVSFAVDNNYTITAIYAAPPSYTITATAGTGGGISPSGGITKNAGESQAFTASPSANYVVNQWLVDGGAVQTGGTSFTLNNIQASRTVQVTFSGGGVVFPLPIPVRPTSFPLSSPSGQGTVVAWGYNNSGQTNVPVGLSGVVAVAAGESHSLALKSDGAVTAWGRNNEAQTSVPVVAQSGVVAVSGGGNYSLALKSDGTVVSWGVNGSGQNTVPVAAQSGVVSVAVGRTHSLALKSDGSVVAWGSNNTGQTNVPAGLSGVVAFAAGHGHSLALKSDGTVIGWGSNGSGQTTVPVAAQSGVVAVAAGNGDSLALKSDGTVVAWGNNGSGQTTVPAAAQNDVVALAAGLFHCVALKSNGTLVAWGDNTTGGQTNIPAGLSGPTTIAAGGFHTLALVGPIPPTVSASRSGNNLTMLWPDSTAGYRLESASSFTTTVTWNNVTGTFQTNAGSISIVLPMTGSLKFYRLIKP